MHQQDTKMTAESLDAVAQKIEQQANKSDEHAIAAAILVREARRRVEAGEVGPVKWFEWARTNIKLSPSRIYGLQKIAKANDPAAALERLRRLTRERVKRHRDNTAKAEREGEETRRKLIAWANKAPIDKVKRMLDSIEMDSGSGLPNSNENRRGQVRLKAA